MADSFVVNVRGASVTVECTYDRGSLDAKMAADKAKIRIAQLVGHKLASVQGSFTDQVSAVDALLAQERAVIPKAYISQIDITVSWPYGRIRQLIVFVVVPTA